MVTSDVEANIDAPVHVAHAFTVHQEESESDYFTVVDDLQRVEDEPGADHIGETELTSGSVLRLRGGRPPHGCSTTSDKMPTWQARSSTDWSA